MSSGMRTSVSVLLNGACKLPSYSVSQVLLLILLLYHYDVHYTPISIAEEIL